MRAAPNWSWCSLEQSVIKDTLPHLKTAKGAERTCAPGLVEVLTLQRPRRRPSHSAEQDQLAREPRGVPVGHLQGVGSRHRGVPFVPIRGGVLGYEATRASSSAWSSRVKFCPHSHLKMARLERQSSSVPRSTVLFPHLHSRTICCKEWRMCTSFPPSRGVIFTAVTSRWATRKPSSHICETDTTCISLYLTLLMLDP